MLGRAVLGAVVMRADSQVLHVLIANERLRDIVHAQIQEMELVRTKIYQLESTHVAMQKKCATMIFCLKSQQF